MEEILIQGSLVQKAHTLVESVIDVGEWAVDATLGNGHDTLFLVGCVGGSGKVVGFDVQQQALESTRDRLLDAAVSDECFDLHLVSHAQMASHLPRKVGAVMFNLGYLPGTDKSLITQTESTLEALGAAIESLRSGGILSVMCYPGHEGGDSEAATVTDWLRFREDVFSELRMHKREGASERSPFLIAGILK